MLNPRALAAAVVAVGAGAVLFLSTGQESANPATPGPVPVAIPPSVTEVPRVHPAVPAAERVSPPSTAAQAPSARPSAVRTPAAPAPVWKAAPAPKQAAAPSTAVQQQPQPAGTEPNGTGGWQLPATVEPPCDAGQTAQVADAGPLAEVVSLVPDLLGGR